MQGYRPMLIVLWTIFLIVTYDNFFVVHSASSRGGNGCKHLAMIDTIGSRRFWNYSKVSIDYSPAKEYTLFKRIGKGAYGEAYTGRNVRTNQDVIIKVYQAGEWTHMKMMREIMITQSLCGSNHIAKLVDIIKDESTDYPALVFEHINNTYYRDLYPRFTPEDVQLYAYQLLQGLEYAHDMGVIHKDLKPSNVVIDHANRRLKIIDWGLARFFYPADNQTVAGTLYYKAPEMFLGFRRYDFRADMWSFGCMLSMWIFRTTPKHFFMGKKEKYSQLREIVKVLGTHDFEKIIKKRNSRVEVDKVVNGTIAKVPWRSFITPRNEEFATPEAINLINQLLVYDHQARLTAHAAMHHPYFRAVRSKILLEEQQRKRAVTAPGAAANLRANG